ncbi:MAG: 50S ribosomal protein L9 [Candidatus Gracilibacteria bacterium]|jgi:large subunit ribosomal protein L9
MQAIFIRDIKGVAHKNDIKNVKPGYLHNYLLPKGIAVPATPEKLKNIAEKKAKEAMRIEELEKNAAEVEKKLSKSKIEISRDGTEKGKLYAAIAEKDIIDAIKEQLKIELGMSNIKLEKHIKTTGDHTVEIILPQDHKANLRVTVVTK